LRASVYRSAPADRNSTVELDLAGGAIPQSRL